MGRGGTRKRRKTTSRRARTLAEIEADVEVYGPTEELKAELRKYKNRVSARNSRARKQRTMAELERKVEELENVVHLKDVEIMDLKAKLKAERELKHAQQNNDFSVNWDLYLGGVLTLT